MFEIGDFIVYGTNGVCRVDAIGPMDLGGVTGDRLYYTLVPVYDKGGRVFTPTDNKKVIMRPVITKDEAVKLIDDIGEIDALWITDDKKREVEYKEAIRKCDTKVWIRIMKMLYQRRELRLAEGKKITASDERYFSMARESLNGELAIALDISKDDVESYIEERMQALVEVE